MQYKVPTLILHILCYILLYKRQDFKADLSNFSFLQCLVSSPYEAGL